MKKNGKKLAIILVFFALTAAAVTAFTTFINSEPHLFSSNDCLECHFTIPDAGDTGPFRFTRPISELCARCHKDLSPLSHSVGMAPSMPMPPGMPLDEQGRMTCATCHDPHKNRIDGRTGNKTYYLRVDKQGKAFCLLCHEDPVHPGEVRIFAVSGGLTHRRSMTRVHGFSDFSEANPDAKLDRLSLLCISCHGSDEHNVDKQQLGSGVYWHKGDGIGLSHPVGVDYDDAAWRNSELVKTDDLDKRLKLFDGKIGCCTCHDPYANGGGEGLVIGVKGSYQDLCLACHNL